MHRALIIVITYSNVYTVVNGKSKEVWAHWIKFSDHLRKDQAVDIPTCLSTNLCDMSSIVLYFIVFFHAVVLPTSEPATNNNSNNNINNDNNNRGSILSVIV